MMRFIGYMACVIVGLVAISFAATEDLPWWGFLLIFAPGFWLLEWAIRADERHKNGL